MAAKNYDWERAKALYRLDKSYREIERETGIPFKTIQRKVEKEGEDNGWVKGDLTQTRLDLTRIALNLTQQNDTARKEVIDEATSQAKKELMIKGLIFDASVVGIKKIAARLKDETDLTKINHGMQALKISRIAAGIDPIHAPKETKSEEQNTGNQTVRLEIVGVSASDTNTR
jgi:hypothetical protein